MKNIQNTCKRILVNFSKQKKPIKGVRNYFKTKPVQQLSQQFQSMSQDDKDSYLNAHNLLYVSYIPTIFLIIPTTLYIGTPEDFIFLQSCNIIQYYTSGLLCFNAFFNQDNLRKYIPLMTAVGIANIITGPYSVLTPLILGGLNFMTPFTDENLHKAQTQEEKQKYKKYLEAQGLFYFIIVVLTTFKAYHFFRIKQLQKKLQKYQKQNEEHFSSQFVE